MDGEFRPIVVNVSATTSTGNDMLMMTVADCDDIECVDVVMVSATGVASQTIATTQATGIVASLT